MSAFDRKVDIRVPLQYPKLSYYHTLRLRVSMRRREFIALVGGTAARPLVARAQLARGPIRATARGAVVTTFPSTLNQRTDHGRRAAGVGGTAERPADSWQCDVGHCARPIRAVLYRQLTLIDPKGPRAMAMLRIIVWGCALTAVAITLKIRLDTPQGPQPLARALVTTHLQKLQGDLALP